MAPRKDGNSVDCHNPDRIPKEAGVESHANRETAPADSSHHYMSTYYIVLNHLHFIFKPQGKREEKAS